MEPDQLVRNQQFTSTTHRDIYPAIDPRQSSLSQKGKVVIITGASRGLGARGFVPSFAATGPRAIVLVARNADKLRQVADSMTKSYPTIEIFSAPTDISDPVSVNTLFMKVKARYGHADVLINNAGVFSEIALVKDVDPIAWWREMAMNIRGTFCVTQNFLKLLPAQDTPAKIITLTSSAAYWVLPTLSAYGISKLCVLELMAYVAIENPNIVAVALHPGVVETDMTKEDFKPVALDTPELVGGIGSWLAGWEGEDRTFLSGRYVSANWDVDDLVNRKEEIIRDNLLKMAANSRPRHQEF